MFSDIVILAGGYGERLWPASRPDFPKQFLSPFEGGVTFLQSALLRALTLDTDGLIIIVTRDDIRELTVKNCFELTERLTQEQNDRLRKKLHIIGEPQPRNTAAAAAFACVYIEKTTGQSGRSCLVLTSDHIIAPYESFASDARKAFIEALNGKLVFFAVMPTEPATGYGYFRGKESMKSKFDISEFVEKPDLDTAKRFLASGDYWWNSGMTGFLSSIFRDELTEHAPDLARPFISLLESTDKPVTAKCSGFTVMEYWAPLAGVYRVIPSLSIDNAVAEKTKKAVAVRASFVWDDIGSWDTYARLFSDHQAVVAEVSSENCFVDSDIPVALCGVKDLIVVIRNGQALVMKRGSSALVKDALRIFRDEE